MSNQRKKVLFVTYGLGVGGAEMLLVNLLNGVNRDKIEPIVVTLASEGELEKRVSEGIRLIRYARRFKCDFKPCLEIARLVRNGNIDSIFVLSPFSYLFVKLATLGKAGKLRVLVSLHTTAPLSIKEYLLTLAYFAMLDRRALLISVCNAQARYLSKKYFMPLWRFHTVYNGVDTDHWSPSPHDFDRRLAREHHGISKDALVIVQVAAFRPEKAHEDAIEALAILHRTSSLKPYLLFVGGGERRIEVRLRRLARSIAIDRHVIFCGQHADVRSFYWIADLFTLSSVAVETFSIAALEAMSTGLPCVLTDLGGAAEMIVEGGNGFLVRRGIPKVLADAWNRVLTGNLSWSAQRIREHVVLRFTLDRCVRSYEDALVS